MFHQYVDPNTGQTMCYMLPQYHEHFSGLLAMIGNMRQSVGQWSDEQIEKYDLFLNDLQSYINTYVFPGVCYDFNHFQNAMITYGTDVNPIGFKLYNHQIEQLSMKAQGKNYKREKKKQKKQNKCRSRIRFTSKRCIKKEKL